MAPRDAFDIRYIHFYSMYLHSYYYSCLISIVYFFYAQVYGSTFPIGILNILHFWRGEILLIYFCHSGACQKQNDNNYCRFPQPPQETNKLMQYFKNLFIKYLDSMYRLRKAHQGCGFSFSHVIYTIFNIYYKFHLIFNIVLWYTRHS